MTTYCIQEHRWYAQLPQILKGFGYEFACFRTYLTGYGYTPEIDASSVWWEGPDGSRIYAVPYYKGAGEYNANSIEQIVRANRAGRSLQEIENMAAQALKGLHRRFYQPKKVPYVLYAIPAEQGNLGERIDFYHRAGFLNGGDYQMKFLLPEEIPGEFGEPEAIFPVESNDFPFFRFPWGGFGSDPFTIPRWAEIGVLAAERIAAMNTLTGGDGFEAELDAIWKKILTVQSHDYIVGMQHRIIPDHFFLYPALEEIKKVEKEALLQLVERINSPRGEGIILMVNPTARERKALIEVNLDSIQAPYSLFDEGEEVPYQIINKNKIVFYVKLPALGYKTLVVKSQKSVGEPKGLRIDKEKMEIETQYYQITLGKNGGLIRLYDKEIKRNILKEGGNSGKFRAWIDGKRYISSGEVRFITTGPLMAIVEEKGKIGSIPYISRMRIYDQLRSIDFEVTFSFNNQNIGKVPDEYGDDYKLGVMFQADSNDLKVHVDHPFIITEAHNYTQEQAKTAPGIAAYGDPELEKYGFFGNFWADVSTITEPHYGFALFNRGTMGYRWGKGEDTLFMPLVYAGESSNVWAFIGVAEKANLLLKGDYTYQYALYPHPGDWRVGDIHQQAAEYTLAPRVIVGKSHKGSLPRRVSLFKYVDDNDNLMLSGLYTREGKLIARFYEYKGKEGKLELLPGEFGLSRIEKTDFMLEEATLVKLPIRFRAHQIQTLRLYLR